MIHSPDPGVILAEMVRVARPGGLILAVEANNVAGALIFDSLNFHDPVDAIVARVRLQLISCRRQEAGVPHALVARFMKLKRWALLAEGR